MTRNPNRKWRKAMWKAVNDAAGNGECSMWTRDVHPIWGMRAIRHFEQTNAVRFDPHNELHTMKTFWMGRQLIRLRHMQTVSKCLGSMADALRKHVGTVS